MDNLPSGDDRSSILAAHRRLIAREKRLVEELMLLERELGTRKVAPSCNFAAAEAREGSPASIRRLAMALV